MRTELEKEIAQETKNPEQEMQYQEIPVEEKRKKDQEDLDGKNQGQSPTREIPENHPSNSNIILTEGHLPMVELGLVPYSPYKHHEVACLEDVYFDPKGKAIVWKLKRI